MGSPITMSGFNQIDFSTILNAVMQQESVPLTTLQAQQKALQSKGTAYTTLATRVSAFESAVADLAGDTGITGRTTTNTDSSIVAASAGDTAAAGIYDIQINELARAQVTAATTFPPDPDQTVVASSGALVIGGVTIAVEGAMTLEDLASLINSQDDVPVTATVVRSAATSWQLVLTGKATGAAGAFTIASTLAGGDGGFALEFGDDDNDGISGNSEVDNAVQATDASVSINNVTVTSASNTIEDAIHGVTLNLLKKAPGTTATITIADDMSAAKTKLQKLVDAYNDLVKFSDDQTAAAVKGDQSSVARDPLLRGLRNSLREYLGAEYDAGGTLKSLATVGIGFERTGKLSFNKTLFDDAAKSGLADIRNLFAADAATPNRGVFKEIQDLVKTYTGADGLLKDLKDRLDQQVSGLATRIADLDSRLQIRRATLQKEYTAADLAMSRMNSQMASISSIGGGYRLF